MDYLDYAAADIERFWLRLIDALQKRQVRARPRSPRNALDRQEPTG